MASPQETRLAQALAMLPGILVQLIEVLDSFGQLELQLAPVAKEALAGFVEACLLLALSVLDLQATSPNPVPPNEGPTEPLH